MNEVREWFTEDIPTDGSPYRIWKAQRSRLRETFILNSISLNDILTEAECKRCSGDGKCTRCDGNGQIVHFCGCEYCYEMHEDCPACKGTTHCPDCQGAGHYQDVKHYSKEAIE